VAEGGEVTDTKWKSKYKPTTVVQILSDNAQVRLGETKWKGVAYLDGKNRVCFRTSEEFYEKFVPAA
jgi:hypothetical protein